MKKLLLWVGILCATCTHSAIITVNKTSDNFNTSDGGCDLREAVTAANTNQAVDDCVAGNGIDLVILDVNAAINLTSQINVTSSMAVRAPFGANQAVEIRAANNQRIFEVYPIQGNGHIFEFVGLHLSGGNAGNEPGGAIYFHDNQTNGLIGEVFVDKCLFENNRALNGGAMALVDTNTTTKVTIRDSHFNYNQSSDNGGGIYIDEGTANEMSLLNNVFTNNTATGNAGAVLIADTGSSDFALNNNQFYQNIADDSGGALALYATTSVQRFIMNRNAFIGNTTTDSGGALFVALDAQAWVYNSIMALNIAEQGGAISTVNAWLYLYHSTLAHNTANSGANIYGHSGTLGSIGSSVLAYPNGGNNCAGAAGSLNTARTIIDDSSCPYNVSLDRREDPLLAGLSFDDDNYPALVPTSDSSAIDGVPTTACNFFGGDSLDSDQQNNPRPIDGDGDNNSECDIGAIEVPMGHDLLWADGFGG
jgi:hypothetical protein